MVLLNSPILTINNSKWGEIQFFVETNLLECEKLWRSVSEDILLTDLWAYRLIFHDAFSKKPYFLYAKSTEQILALLPMEFLDLEDGYYSWFGGGVWNEQNRVYVIPGIPQEIINKLYELAPAPCYLHSIPEIQGKMVPLAKPEMETYIIDTQELNYSMDNLYLRMSTDSRKSVRRYIRQFEEMKPDLRINHFEDIPKMIALNKLRFGEESTFNKPFFEEALLRVINSPTIRPFLRILSLYFNGELKSCAVNGFYKGNYIYLASGTDETRANLPKYLVHILISDALNLKAQRIFVLSYDCGWKERYRVKKFALYLVEKS